MSESTDDKIESEYEHERGFAMQDGWMHAQVDLECCNPLCGLPIHIGDPIILGDFGYCHPLCDAEHALDVAAERAHDMRREG